MDKRMFWSVLAALLAFALLVGIARELRMYFAVREMKSVMQSQLAASRAQTAQDRHQRQVRKRQQAEHDRRSRALADTQQCLGHTVVDVAGASYVQLLGANGKPVPCHGRFADVAIR